MSTGRQLLGSSLRANAVAHTSGRVKSRAVPRRESDPEPDILVNRPLSDPESILRWQFDLRKALPLLALSRGDRFTTRLTYRIGMVLVHGKGGVSSEVSKENEKRYRGTPAAGEPAAIPPPLVIAPFTLVRWFDTEEQENAVELSPAILVVPGWWEVMCPCGLTMPHTACQES